MFRQIAEARINDLHCKFDEESGLKSVIAIHSTRRGPALGGCRIIPYSVPCDLFSPCGLGGVLNSDTIGKLQCAAVAGSANNQLLTEEDGIALFDRDILFAPDYLINSGGLIFVAMTYLQSSQSDMHHRLRGIHDTLLEIFNRQNQAGLPASVIADQMAEAIVHGDNPSQLTA
ncbi:hypothetical protein [Endozoicomonas sp. GU-1]|uniref:hypothetical protein n=1 Tax=Endozoicomonas sp. GU-1 TaxID=3009078 RepID=UPI0022B5D6D2|nr:hypothetical protein [Endozoicomonas sp. GU-1]WBA81597.1 hypothetical protein O2T12_25580 [Endozoicomonas sp. GU-1]WBA84550.1 hypothetical protein O3276_14755 [Endozoicomonas sp. GU-1]